MSIVNLRRVALVLLLLLLGACGGGGGTDEDEVIHISERGFAESGIFVGALDTTEVLLVLQEPDYFLLAGTFASSGNYTTTSTQLTATGVAYNLSGTNEVTGNLVIRGEYRTDRHVDLVWQEPVTGVERSLIVEASDLYFRESDITRVLGAWINQDEGNLTFLSISENRSPIAGNDFFPVAPGTQTEIPVLANDRDPDGHQIRISDLDNASSGGGQLTLDNGGTPDDPTDDRVLYRPPASLTSGTDTFSYDIQDELDGSDSATVTITVPVRELDVSLAMVVSSEVPLAGDIITLTATLTNNSVGTGAQVQVMVELPSGLRYRGDDGAGAFLADSGFWAINLPAGAARTLEIDLLVGSFGPFGVRGSISAMDAVDTNPANNVVELTLVPGNLSPAPVSQPRQASIEGVILSSLSQISGTITEAQNGSNAFAIQIGLGTGALGGGVVDPYFGFVVLNEELVETASEDEEEGTGESTTEELRPTMLILTTNPTSVYVNKLFFISEDELNENDG